jgi:hypothetical protein
MSTAINHITQAQPAATQSKTAPPQPQAQPQPAPKDTVTISAAAALRQELTETSVQTAHEASQGDIQAKNLLAREAAFKKAGL